MSMSHQNQRRECVDIRKLKWLVFFYGLLVINGWNNSFNARYEHQVNVHKIWAPVPLYCTLFQSSKKTRFRLGPIFSDKRIINANLKKATPYNIETTPDTWKLTGLLYFIPIGGHLSSTTPIGIFFSCKSCAFPKLLALIGHYLWVKFSQ